MTSRILVDPVAVRNRLDEMGLTYDELIEVVGAMVGERALCTDNDPPGARGWASWRMGIRRLRELLCRKEGWVKDDTDQVSSVLNQDRALRITVSNTDENTGIEDLILHPRNRTEKGIVTTRIVRQNQYSFMAILDGSMDVVQFPQATTSVPVITWYLCLYNEGDVVRAELSCPDDLENGFFAGFLERIILLGLETPDKDAPRRYGDNDGEDGPDVPVKRRTRET